MCTRTQAPMDTAHVCVSVVHPPVCVHGGTTSSVVPPRTQKGGRMAWVQTWVVSVGASVLVRFLSVNVCTDTPRRCH